MNERLSKHSIETSTKRRITFERNDLIILNITFSFLSLFLLFHSFFRSFVLSLYLSSFTHQRISSYSPYVSVFFSSFIYSTFRSLFFFFFFSSPHFLYILSQYNVSLISPNVSTFITRQSIERRKKKLIYSLIIVALLSLVFFSSCPICASLSLSYHHHHHYDEDDVDSFGLSNQLSTNRLWANLLDFPSDSCRYLSMSMR